MGAFPNLSRSVPFCPRLSSFVPICPHSGRQEGQKRTNGDKMGHFGTNWETHPFSVYPHLALLKFCSVSDKKVAHFCFCLVRIKMLLLTCLGGFGPSMKSCASHNQKINDYHEAAQGGGLHELLLGKKIKADSLVSLFALS